MNKRVILWEHMFLCGEMPRPSAKVSSP
jgi:hypothetical protein